MIVLKKNKPDLKTMFDNYLKELSKKEREYDLYDGAYRQYLIDKYRREEEDDEMTSDDYYELFGYKKSKSAWNKTRSLLEGYIKGGKQRKGKKQSSKRGKRGNKKNKNRNIIDEDDMMYDAQMDNKTIYFYRDIDNPDYNVEIFYSLHEFDDFLSREGIEISDDEVRSIMTRDISHCCINPDIRATNGEVQLLSDSSYGGLHWSCHDDDIYANSFPTE